MATCGHSAAGHWQWQQLARQCGYHRLNQRRLRSLLREKWLVLIGDSIARNLYASLLRHVADPRDNQAVVKAHKDFEYTLPNGIRASFFWAPYAENATAIIAGWQAKPAAFVVSIGLWHMLHIHDLQDFKASLQSLRHSLTALNHPAEGVESDGQTERQTVQHFLSLTAVAQEKLVADDKKQYMTTANVYSYNQALHSSGLLQPKGPSQLIDMHSITQGCGPTCTEDGVHYTEAAYDAAFQIWANSFLLDGLM